MIPLAQSPEWRALLAHRDQLAPRHLNDLFNEDAQRFANFSLSQGKLLVDFSKQRVTADTLHLLTQLADARDLAGFLRRMAAGETINHTEQRAVLHIAMRADGHDKSYSVAGVDVMPQVRETRARMRALVDALRAGKIMGASGKLLRKVVNIGIGGSDLGPRMAVQALDNPNQRPAIEVRFVANIDPAEFATTVRDLDPAETLFIVASKTFTTQETLANANAAKAWLAAALGNADIGNHFVAISNNVAAAEAFGIAKERCYAMPEWVGGRYSLWSAIGLPLACAIGMDAFEEVLAGAREMDMHFLNAPFARNLPVLMALIGIWNIDFLGATSLAVLPYSYQLGLLPSYLQQLDMESNGKHVTREGDAVGVMTAPILWGSAGTVGQHAFHQLFYQGTHVTPIDFVVPVGDAEPAQEALVANALAQSAALMKGKTADDAEKALLAAGRSAAEAARLAPHLACPGNQPSTMLLLPQLTPHAMGQLLALYEHKVAVQGCIWNVNSFDQWGVEYGKQMAREILPKMLAGTGNFDASTAGLLAAIRAGRK